MALETGTYPSDFVTTNPASGDPVSQADDHIRLLKSCTKAALPIGAPVYPLTSGTAAATTAGTSVDYLSIPSWAKRITISMSGVSTNGASPIIIQLGISTGVETSGYLGSIAALQDVTAISAVNFTNGIAIAPSVNAATTYHGVVTLTLVTTASNTWVASVTGGISNAQASFVGGFTKPLAGTLDRVRLTTSGGVNTFDAGLVNILYE